MINIAICDDELYIVQQMYQLITDYFLKSRIKYTIHCFTSPQEFSNSKLSLYDIVFLDVQLGDIDGLTVAKNLRKVNANAVLIFVSQYNDYTTEGYRVKAFRYILKPTLSRFFEDDMDNALQELNLNNQKYEFKVYGEQMSLQYDDILYFESQASKVEIKTISPTFEPFSFTSKLDDVEEELAQAPFVRVQQSLLVNVF